MIPNLILNISFHVQEIFNPTQSSTKMKPNLIILVSKKDIAAAILSLIYLFLIDIGQSVKNCQRVDKTVRGA
jgi:hypothetical protein